MVRKFFIAVFFISFFINGFSQDSEKMLYAKANTLFLPLGMLNAGLEYQLSEKYTFQGDIFISPWKSFGGNHSQIYMAHLEGRYYFNKAFDKWYIGANGGFGVFDLTKWNYRDTNYFQRGMAFMFGATIGYQLQCKEKWNVDFYLGGGTIQSLYHGYEEVPPGFLKRYDGANDWNKSSEFLPYRGGIMISYQLK